MPWATGDRKSSEHVHHKSNENVNKFIENGYPVTKTDSAKYLALGIDKDLADSESQNEDRSRPLDTYCPAIIPIGGIAMAVFLTLGGAYLMVYGLLVLTGFCVPKHPDGIWIRVALGILTFIPGVYHVRLALFAYLEVPGFSFSDFPDY